GSNLPPPARTASWANSIFRPMRIQLRCFARSLGFNGFLAANVDLDLLRLGFCLLRQLNLQHAFIVLCGDLFRVYGRGQSERTGEAAILAFHSAIVLLFLFLLELSLTDDS